MPVFRLPSEVCDHISFTTLNSASMLCNCDCEQSTGEYEAELAHHYDRAPEVPEGLSRTFLNEDAQGVRAEQLQLSIGAHGDIPTTEYLPSAQEKQGVSSMGDYQTYARQYRGQRTATNPMMKSLAETATAAGLFAANMLESSLNVTDHHHHHHHHYKEPLTKPDCALCKGRGFVHHSSMRHDKLPDQKCFWCKECPSCAGSCVMEHNEVSCRRCKGHGFMFHASQKGA